MLPCCQGSLYGYTEEFPEEHEDRIFRYSEPGTSGDLRTRQQVPLPKDHFPIVDP